MKYEKPEITVEKFTFEPVMADITSAIDPDPTEDGPVIEVNDPTFELAQAFSNVFNFNK